MSALETAFSEVIAERFSDEVVERMVAVQIRGVVAAELMACEGMIRLRAVPALVGETTMKRTLSLLAALGVPVRVVSARRKYVLRSELEAAMRGIPTVEASSLLAARGAYPLSASAQNLRTAHVAGDIREVSRECADADPLSGVPFEVGGREQ